MLIEARGSNLNYLIAIIIEVFKFSKFINFMFFSVMDTKGTIMHQVRAYLKLKSTQPGLVLESSPTKRSEINIQTH